MLSASLSPYHLTGVGNPPAGATGQGQPLLLHKLGTHGARKGPLGTPRLCLSVASCTPARTPPAPLPPCSFTHQRFSTITPIHELQAEVTLFLLPSSVVGMKMSGDFGGLSVNQGSRPTLFFPRRCWQTRWQGGPGSAAVVVSGRFLHQLPLFLINRAHRPDTACLSTQKRAECWRVNLFPVPSQERQPKGVQSKVP